VPAFLVGLLLLAGALVGSGNIPFGSALIPQTPSQTPVGAVCIDPSALDSAPVVLSGVPKAKQDNTPFPNSTLGGYNCASFGTECKNPDGSAQPDTADYVLAASNVKVERIWPHSRTTRLYKQILPNTFPEYDKYKDRVYRASCNDWCGLGLPYGGTYHCNFIWLYTDDRFQTLRDDVRNVDEQYPDDRGCDLKNDPDKCPTFNVLIRKTAPWPVPDEINCQKITPTPVSQGSEVLSTLADKVFAGTRETFIDLAGHRWILHRNPRSPDGKYTLNKNELRTADPPTTPDNFDSGRVKVADNVVFSLEDTPEQYEAFYNLTNKFGLNEDYLYLVPPGKVTQTDIATSPSDPNFTFNFLEFRKSPEVKPKGFSLQLGTFTIPVHEGWWKEWIKESKPAIYLYPEKPMNLRIKLNPAGKLTTVDPPYDPIKGWEITAYPDGTIKPLAINNQLSATSYPYLFYEAEINKVYIEPKGFVVAFGDLVGFFQKELPAWGLNSTETKDFIDYWMARFDESKPYYFIHFLDREQIEKLEPLEIYQLDPGSSYINRSRIVNVQTAIRIRTYFKAMDSPTQLGKISPQAPPPVPARTGFTLVEWGGFLDE